MKEYTIERSNGIPLSFSGQIVARVSSGPKNGEATHKKRWTVLILYKTTGGQYVCSQIGKTQIEGEQERVKAIVAKDAAAIIDFFGAGPLAAALYRELGIKPVKRVS